jgi:glycine betaine/choline ABC-type transport system substrate-binding protein
MHRRRALATLAALGGAALAGGCKRSSRVRVGSKNFAESVLLGEILAQQLARRGLEVDHKANLGGTFVCHRAMLSGDLDVYVEYTGTALVAILKDERIPRLTDPAEVRAAVEKAYLEKFGLEWLPGLGFDDTFAILVRKADADRLGLAKVSDLGPHAGDLHPGFGYEFVERSDGFRAFCAAYGLTFKDPPATMELGLTYRALAESKVDLIAGNSTSGLIDKLGLVQLVDDEHFFPPYEAAPVVRRAVIEKTPKIASVLGELSGKLTTAKMRSMNDAIEAGGRAPRDVAKEFLDALGA